MSAARAGDVVTLRDDDGPTIVLVHPVGGNVFCYGPLARKLDGWRVLGIRRSRTTSLDGGVPDLARRYMDALDDASIAPAVVGGWSFGAVAAFEMARVLEDRSGPLPTVLIDPPRVPSGPPASSPLARALRVALRDLCRMTETPRPDVWPVLESMDDVEGACRQLGVLTELRPDDRRWIFELYAASGVELARWRPTGGIGRILEIRALNSHFGSGDRGWSALAHVHEAQEVAGTHEFLTDKQNAEALAGSIRDLWRRADATVSH